MNAGHGKRSIMHFNPRSHEGSDQTALIIARERWIFQSTLPRGERRLQIWVMKCSLRFQSTLPRGERQYFHFCSKMLKKISIHAPTRGATTFPGTFRSTYNYFNPRSHEGSDMIAPYDWQLLQVFQSTLPRGERLLMFCLIVPLLNFNPRSHEGSDILPVPPPAAVSISIHAPTRGATVIYSHKKESRRFQSTLPRGERRRSSHKCI